MAAYVVADVLPDDLEAYQTSGYREAVWATSAPYGEVTRAAGGEMVVLEGDWEPERMVIVEFPSMDQLLAWYHSPEYQERVPVRQRLVPNSKLVALDGLP